MGTIVHVTAVASRGGTEFGMNTLFNRGFYAGYDVHAVVLQRHTGEILPEFERSLGQDKVHCLTSKDEKYQYTVADIPVLAWKLNQIFTAIKPDVAVLSSHIGNITGRLAAMRRPNMRVITFEHSAQKLSPKIAAGLRATSFRCNAVFGDSPETARAMAQYKTRELPTYDVPLTILTPGTQRPACQPPNIKLIAVGRLSDEKNYANLIPAVAALRSEGHLIELDIHGEGPKRAELTRLIGDLGMTGYIRLKGFTPTGKQLDAARDAAHIQVTPSKLEGFCLAVAEGIASGLPTVATDVGGMRDYGIHGKNMLKIPKNPDDRHAPDAETIAATLRPLINNYASMAPRLSAGGIATARERFSKAAVMEKWRLARTAFAPAQPKRWFYDLRAVLHLNQLAK